MNRFFCTPTEPAVSTDKGKLRGYYFDGVYYFLGVPYAKARRFQMPEPVDPWEGIRPCLAFGNICPILQEPAPGDEIVVPHRFWTSSEHCQNLNVWTDTLDPNAKKPVLVWFHGGGYSSGSAIEHIAYDGDRLAKYDDVVTVCVNHRLNAFGHMDMSAFGDKYANSVNVGIADLVAALEWIRDNIANFGGDPGNITIFGQSGGGGKVTTLGQTPAADGLFHKAIIMSGVFDFNGGEEPPKEVEPKAFALEVMHQLGLGDDDAEGLEKAPVRLFIRAVNKAVRKFQLQGYAVNWAPHANDWYVGDPLEVGFRDAYAKVPTIVGTVLCEFAGDTGIDAKESVPTAEREAFILNRFGEENGKKALELFRAAYPGKNELYAACVDLASRPASNRYVRTKAAAGKAPVYSYMFASCFDYAGGRAPWHCADIPFCFHNAERVPFTFSIPYQERLEKQMTASFVSFARTGDPSNPYIPAWTPSDGKALPTMIFDEETRQATDYDDELLAFLGGITPHFHFHFTTPDEDEESGREWVY